MSERRGSVWFERERVGSLLDRGDGALGFTYEPDWLERGFSISLSLPLSDLESAADAFFGGLLPEGLARQRVCRQYRLPEDDDMGLLLAIGRDCAGALAVFPEGELPETEEPAVRISEDDLTRVVETRGQAMPTAAARPRFSLAGAQDKLAVRIDDNGMWLPTSEQPSSHILKFETLRWVCFAEWAANDMARQAGLNVPDETFTFHPTDPPTPFLRIVRYDRRRDADGRLFRVHQEDVTQALGLSSRRKYEEDGGPSLGAVASLLRRHSSDPVRDVGMLRDWQLFNYLVGNSDGHAKNLALLYEPGSAVLRLAPMYDLVCIEYLNRIGLHYDRKLAFFIGDKNVPEEITKHEWASHARDLGMPDKPLLKKLRELAEELPGMARTTREHFADSFGDNPVLDRFEESIRDRCSWTIRSVFGKG